MADLDLMRKRAERRLQRYELGARLSARDVRWFMRHDLEWVFSRCRHCDHPMRSTGRVTRERVGWSYPHAPWGKPIWCKARRSASARRLVCLDCRAHRAGGGHQARTRARAEARADRHCLVCQRPLVAQRASRLTCSVTCRVAHWRAVRRSRHPNRHSAR